jgi:hypothetical protein
MGHLISIYTHSERLRSRVYVCERSVRVHTVATDACSLNVEHSTDQVAWSIKMVCAQTRARVPRSVHVCK